MSTLPKGHAFVRHNNKPDVRLSRAHQRPERSHNTDQPKYDILCTYNTALSKTIFIKYYMETHTPQWIQMCMTLISIIHAHMCERTHTDYDCSRNWALILVGAKILWEEEGFQFGLKRWQGWTVSKVLWEWTPNVGSNARDHDLRVELDTPLTWRSLQLYQAVNWKVTVLTYTMTSLSWSACGHRCPFTQSVATLTSCELKEYQRVSSGQALSHVRDTK